MDAHRRHRTLGLLVAAVSSLLPCIAVAGLLGTYAHRDGTVRLMTEPCRPDRPAAGQLAQQSTASGERRQGCWGVDADGNPVVTWADGAEQVLNGNHVRLSRKTAALLEEAPSKVPRESVGGFSRPVWCADARFPHEKMICSDPALAAQDLRLVPLWRAYRGSLSPAAEARVKRDYFARLKTCGADKRCIAAQQQAQMRRYREALPANG